MNKFLDENNFDDKEANKCVGIHGAIFDVDGTLLDSMVTVSYTHLRAHET